MILAFDFVIKIRKNHEDLTEQRQTLKFLIIYMRFCELTPNVCTTTSYIIRVKSFCRSSNEFSTEFKRYNNVQW